MTDPAPHAPEGPHAAPVDAGDPLFPAGFAAVALSVGFTFTRVFIGLAGQRSALAAFGSFATVTGALLALVAIARHAWSPGASLGLVARALRAVTLAPLVALSFAGMFTLDVALPLQWAALASLSALVLVAGVRGLVLSALRGAPLASATLALVVLGEEFELFGPVLKLASRNSAALARLTQVAGTLGEVAAVLGVTLAFVWSFRAAFRQLGATRTAIFLAVPATFTLVLVRIAVKLPRKSELVARAAFGARFDLAGVGGARHPSAGALVGYASLFALMVGAASLSFASAPVDGGAGARRGIAWVALLLAGFGAVSIAGVIDPLRAVLVAFAVLLLEAAVEREPAR